MQLCAQEAPKRKQRGVKRVGERGGGGGREKEKRRRPSKVGICCLEMKLKLRTEKSFENLLFPSRIENEVRHHIRHKWQSRQTTSYGSTAPYARKRNTKKTSKHRENLFHVKKKGKLIVLKKLCWKFSVRRRAMQ